MTSFQLHIRAETLQDDDAIEQLTAQAFGPGRFSRTAFRLREGVEHEHALSFVAIMEKLDGGGKELVGSVRLTRVLIGEEPALVLGPLVVARARKNLGIGRELMHRSLAEARERGDRFVILVGDHPYYAKFGFHPVPGGRITLPGPVDPDRLLYCALEAGIEARYSGQTRRFVQ